ncbi:MAG: flagellar filament capping protein FliD [Oscillospiraceae bacterium]|jgi:flagellar hook-associated protein 2|nr:flagellar filament capping protein FliD [Oscillospiraceae bacterium]
MAISTTPLRLTGLASGMDTDSIIKTLMQIEQLKMDRQTRAKTILEWRQQALTDIKSEMTTFKQNFASVLGAESLLKESAYNAYKVSLSGANTSAVSITSTVHATPGTITINSITSLAKGASAESDGKLSTDVNGALGLNGAAADTKLGDLKLSGDLFAGGSMLSFKINGESFSFSKDDSLGTMINTVNANAAAGVTMSYSSLTDKLSVETKSVGADAKLKIENLSGNAFGVNSAFKINTGGAITSKAIKDVNGNALTSASTWITLGALQPAGGGSLFASDDPSATVEFKINGEPFSFGRNDTLQAVIDDIKLHANVEIDISGDGIITIKNKTDSSNPDDHTDLITPKIENISGNFFGANSVLGIDSTTGQTMIFQNGTNAKARINGVDIERTSNSFSIDGLNFTLNSESTTEIKADVTRDATEVVDKIKTFVTGYNTLIKKLEDMLAEKKTTDEAKYTPLTDEEKASLSEEQIASWEAIAKKGLLRNDSGIKSMLTSLRNALYETVTGAGLAPSSIGIKTGSYFAGTGGQIVVDEDALRAAIEKDPERVMQIFANTSSAADSSTKYKENGLLTRMSNIMDRYLNSYQITALDGISSSLTQINTKITDLEAKMSAKQEQLYLKFAAMETAMSAMNSQSEWLSGIMNQSST